MHLTRSKQSIGVAAIVACLRLLPYIEAQACAPNYAQCGGTDFAGPIKCCSTSYACMLDNAYWSACRPRTGGATARPTPRPSSHPTTQQRQPTPKPATGTCPKLVQKPSQPGFQITLYNPTCNTTYDSVFQAAARSWESVITGDLADLRHGEWLDPAKGFGSFGGTIDDVLISYRWDKIDGVGGILGQAGLLYMRAESDGHFNAASGAMTFDSADLDWLAQTDQLLKVIKHEMGHALGIGTLWDNNGCSVCGHAGATGTPAEFKYTCPAAAAAFKRRGFTGALQVANEGGMSTKCSHWDEQQLDREIMTGYIEDHGVQMPLSAISVGTLEDMGYQVRYSAAQSIGPGNFQRRTTETAADDDDTAAGGAAKAAAGGGGGSDNNGGSGGSSGRRPRGTSGPGKGRVGEGFYLEVGDLCGDRGICPQAVRAPVERIKD